MRIFYLIFVERNVMKYKSNFAILLMAALMAVSAMPAMADDVPAESTAETQSAQNGIQTAKQYVDIKFQI